jgi:putative component of toxin-antitoxin plasmid stabilization module
MYLIKTNREFDRWFGRLKDPITRQRLNVRLRKAVLGNLGDVKATNLATLLEE